MRYEESRRYILTIIPIYSSHYRFGVHLAEGIIFIGGLSAVITDPLISNAVRVIPSVACFVVITGGTMRLIAPRAMNHFDENFWPASVCNRAAGLRRPSHSIKNSDRYITFDSGVKPSGHGIRIRIRYSWTFIGAACFFGTRPLMSISCLSCPIERAWSHVLMHGHRTSIM